MTLLAAVLLAFAAQEIPAQRGLVNDFAGVMDADSHAKTLELCHGLLKHRRRKRPK